MLAKMKKKVINVFFRNAFEKLLLRKNRKSFSKYLYYLTFYKLMSNWKLAHLELVSYMFTKEKLKLFLNGNNLIDRPNMKYLTWSWITNCVERFGSLYHVPTTILQILWIGQNRYLVNKCSDSNFSAIALSNYIVAFHYVLLRDNCLERLRRGWHH